MLSLLDYVDFADFAELAILQNSKNRQFRQVARILGKNLSQQVLSQQSVSRMIYKVHVVPHRTGAGRAR